MPRSLAILIVVLSVVTLAVAVVVAAQVATLRGEIAALRARDDGSSSGEQARIAEAVLSLEEGVEAMRGELDRMVAQTRESGASLAALREQVAAMPRERDGREARDGGDRDGWRPPEPAELVQRLGEQVQLDADAQTRLKAVLERQQAEMRELFTQMRSGGDAAQQARESFRGVHERFAAEWAEILSPEQVEALQAALRPRGRGRWGRGDEQPQQPQRSMPEAANQF